MLYFEVNMDSLTRCKDLLGGILNAIGRQQELLLQVLLLFLKLGTIVVYKWIQQVLKTAPQLGSGTPEAKDSPGIIQHRIRSRTPRQGFRRMV